MVRIRYRFDESTRSYLSKSFMVGTDLVAISLSSERSSFSITSLNTGAVLESGSASSLPALKSAAKLALSKLGVLFTGEMRHRKSA